MTHVFIHNSTTISLLFIAFVCEFVLVLSRMAVLVLVHGRKKHFDYEHEHHFIVHERARRRKDMSNDKAH